jgi:hypothetical protein
MWWLSRRSSTRAHYSEAWGCRRGHVLWISPAREGKMRTKLVEGTKTTQCRREDSIPATSAKMNIINEVLLVPHEYRLELPFH